MRHRHCAGDINIDDFVNKIDELTTQKEQEILEV